MSRKILTIALTSEGNLDAMAYETLGAARSIAGEGGNVETLLLGENIEDAAKELAKTGTAVIKADHPDFKYFSLENAKEVAVKVCTERKPDVILLAGDLYGRELGPALAGRLGAGHLTDLISIKASDDGVISGETTVYGGRFIAEMTFRDTELQIASLRPHAFAQVQADGTEGSIEEISVDDVEGGARIKEVLKAEDYLDVADAKIIIAGGRGIKSKDNFEVLDELASLLNGSVGASRAAVDEGWREHRDQVGQTGKTVSPEVYIACGISGAVQHTAGMNRAKCIVAVNKDPDAPIMKIADYAVEGDLFEIIPALTAKIKETLK